MEDIYIYICVCIYIYIHIDICFYGDNVESSVRNTYLKEKKDDINRSTLFPISVRTFLKPPRWLFYMCISTISLFSSVSDD